MSWIREVRHVNKNLASAIMEDHREKIGLGCACSLFLPLKGGTNMTGSHVNVFAFGASESTNTLLAYHYRQANAC